MMTQRHRDKQQAIREAEGYLELLHCSLPHTRLSIESREPIARRALEMLDRGTGEQPWSAQALFLRGQALRALEQYSDAVESFRLAAQLSPRNRHIWLAMAWCYKRCQRVDLAIEALEEALLFAPEVAILYYNLACYWSLSRNVYRAVVYLGRAFELNPSYRDQVSHEPDFDAIRHHPHFKNATSVIV